MANNKRIRFLLGFGGLAVVLLVVFNMWYPPVSEEATTGSVVAVKKHRQQQIAPQDVILGDEASRKAEQALYGDFLDDASKLENVSAELAVVLRSRQAPDADLGVARSSLEAAARELDSHSRALQVRALESAREELGVMRQLFAAAPADLAVRGEIEAQLAQIARMVENRTTLESAAMEGVGLELASVSNKLETHVLEGASVGATAKSLDAVERNLRNKDVQLAAVNAELGAVTQRLGRSAAIDAAALEHRTAHLAAIAKEHRSIESARKTLDAAIANLAVANRLEATNAEALEQASRALSSRAADLEALAVTNLESRAALLTLESRGVAELDQALGLVAKAIESRRNTLDAAARHDLDLAVRAADAALESRRAALESVSLASMKNELAAVGRFLDARAKVENRRTEAGLGSRSTGLGKMTQYLSRMSTLGVRAPFATMESRNVEANLAAQARELESRAKMMQATSKE